MLSAAGGSLGELGEKKGFALPSHRGRDGVSLGLSAATAGEDARSQVAWPKGHTQTLSPEAGAGAAGMTVAPSTVRALWAKAAQEGTPARNAPPADVGVPSRRSVVVLTLDPPLGRTVVRLVAQGDSLKAVVVAQSRAALAQLQEMRPEVRLALARSGHQVTDIRITSLAGDSRSGGRRFTHGRRRR